MSIETFHKIGVFFLIYFGIVNGIYALLLIFSLRPSFVRINRSKQDAPSYIIKSNTLPEITLMIPAYNESETIVGNILELLSLSYRNKQILVINDGSTDDTLDKLITFFKLTKTNNVSFNLDLPTKQINGIYESETYKGLTVIDKVWGGRYDALNAGLNVCQSHCLITLDADTIIDNRYFTKIIRPLFSNLNTVAIGSCVRILNGCSIKHNNISTENFPDSYTSSMQAIEYLRTFQMRMGWNYLGGNFVISGAFGFFHRDILKKIGGFGPTFANDMEVVVRLNRLLKATNTPYKISYIPYPIAWTEGPKSIKELSHQRKLWHRGLFDTLWYHKSLLFNPKYGAYGSFVYPFMLLGEGLEPLVEISAYLFILIGLILGYISWPFILIFLCITWFLTVTYSIFCLFIEEYSDRTYPSLKTLIYLSTFSFIEIFGYRQMTIFWRLAGLFNFFRNFKEVRKYSKEINTAIKEVESNKRGLFESQ